MQELSLLSGNNDQLYRQWLSGHEHASLWQSLEWRAFQEALGRETRLYAIIDDGMLAASALVIIDKTVFGAATWDIPRGPLFHSALPEEQKIAFLLKIASEAKQNRCLSLISSPLSPIAFPGTTPSSRHEQPEATRVLDLTRSEEDILKQMKPKGRYNIAVAQRHGVRIQQSEDVDAFHDLARETARRDGFTTRPASHFRSFLHRLPHSFLLLAYKQESSKPVAGLLGVIWDKTGIYYYGASSYEDRSIMAPYLLQWEAMLHCKQKGCASYDLLGIAPPLAGANHPWQGVSTFKEKFGGIVVTYPPEQILTLRPLLTALLDFKRRMVG